MLCLSDLFYTRKGKGKDKIHPKTDYEGPEME